MPDTPGLLLTLAAEPGPLPGPLLAALRTWLGSHPQNKTLRLALLARTELPGDVVREVYENYCGARSADLATAYLDHPAVPRERASAELCAPWPQLHGRYANKGRTPHLLAMLAGNQNLILAQQAAGNPNCPDEAALAVLQRWQPTYAGKLTGSTPGIPADSTGNERVAAVLDAHPSREFLLAVAATCTHVPVLLNVIDRGVLCGADLNTAVDALLDATLLGECGPADRAVMLMTAGLWFNDPDAPHRAAASARIIDRLRGREFTHPTAATLAADLLRQADLTPLQTPVPKVTDTVRIHPGHAGAIRAEACASLGDNDAAWLLFTTLAGTFTGTIEELLACCTAGSGDRDR